MRPLPSVLIAVLLAAAPLAAGPVPFADELPPVIVATWPDDRAEIRVETGVPEARVRVWGSSAWHLRSKEVSTTADAEGNAVIRLGADELRVGSVHVEAAAPGYVPRRMRVPESGVVSCRLSLGSVLRGVVLGPDREPLENAEVRAVLKGTEDVTRTDARGRFSLILTQPPGRPVDASIVVIHPAHPWRVLDVRAPDRDITITLERGLDASGWLVAPDGTPIAGVDVRGGRQSARTDEKGRFLLRGLAPAPTTLVIGSRPGGPEVCEIVPGREPMRHVSRGFVLDVKVVDSNGRVYDRNAFVRATTSGASGRVLGPHRLPLVVRSGRRVSLSAYVPGVGRAGTTCDLSGEPGLRVETLVLRPDPREATIRVRDAEGGIPRRVRISPYPERGRLPRGRVSDLDSEGGCHTRHLPWGPRRVRFEPAEGFSRSEYRLPVEIDVPAAEDRPSPVEIVFPIGGRLRVLVRRAGDGVVPPIGLVLRDAAGKEVGRFVQRLPSGNWTQVRTAPKEAFLLHPIPPGVYTLVPSLTCPASFHCRVRIREGRTTAVAVLDS